AWATSSSPEPPRHRARPGLQVRALSYIVTVRGAGLQVRALAFACRAGRVGGHQAAAGAGGAQFGQPAVGGLADQGGQLGLVLLVQGLAGGVRLRRRRTPPVQLVPALAPAAPVELGDRADQDLGGVGPGGPVLLAADRQLPAHVRLVLQRMLAVAQRLAVQGTSAAAGEVGVVEEHARAVLAGRGTPLGRAAVDGVHLRVVLETLAEVLPRLRREGLHSGPDPLLVVLVGEERAVRTASVAGPALDDAVAAATEDAVPARQQPGQVRADHVLFVGRVDELDPLPGEVEVHFAVAGFVGLHVHVDLFTAGHLKSLRRGALCGA